MAEPLGYSDFLSIIETRFGIRFTCEDTGGSHLLFQARLETGDWLLVSDWDAGLHPLAERRELDARGITIGWNITIYADDGIDGPDHCTMLASVRDESATVDELNGMIGLALHGLPSNTHHEYRADRMHTVTRGIINT